MSYVFQLLLPLMPNRGLQPSDILLFLNGLGMNYGVGRRAMPWSSKYIGYDDALCTDHPEVSHSGPY